MFWPNLKIIGHKCSIPTKKHDPHGTGLVFLIWNTYRKNWKVFMSKREGPIWKNNLAQLFLWWPSTKIVEIILMIWFFKNMASPIESWWAMQDFIAFLFIFIYMYFTFLCTVLLWYRNKYNLHIYWFLQILLESYFSFCLYKILTMGHWVIIIAYSEHFVLSWAKNKLL